MLQGVACHNSHLAQGGLHAGPGGEAIEVARVQEARPVWRDDEVHLGVENPKRACRQPAVVADAAGRAWRLGAFHAAVLVAAVLDAAVFQAVVFHAIAPAHQVKAQLRQVAQGLHGPLELWEAFVRGPIHVVLRHKTHVQAVFAQAIAGAVPGQLGVEIIGVGHHALD